MTPLNLGDLLGHNYWVFLLIGIGFGFALEISGFGDSRRLAAQFYFYEMRVLKVMFTAIITAMLLIFFTSAFGLLDFSKVFVNPTYLWPEIVGGLVMGVGFIIGGFCPGTSIVGAATLKLDAWVFLLGVFFGVFLFGESAPHIDTFFNSSFYGRLTLFDLFEVDAGWVVLGVLIFALGSFFLAEWGEKKMGINKKNSVQSNVDVDLKSDLNSDVDSNLKSNLKSNVDLNLKSQLKLLPVLIVLALVIASLTLFKGQPNPETRWHWIEAQETPNLESKQYHIAPMELRDLMINPEISLQILDLRNESDYNLFHLENSVLVTPKQIIQTNWLKKLLIVPTNRIVVLIGNDDFQSTDVWKLLKGMDIINLYILDGGLNNWLVFFPLDSQIATPRAQHEPESFSFDFSKAVGESQFSSFPYDPVRLENNLKLNYTKKVKMQSKSAVKGGCG